MNCPKYNILKCQLQVFAIVSLQSLLSYYIMQHVYKKDLCSTQILSVLLDDFCV